MNMKAIGQLMIVNKNIILIFFLYEIDLQFDLRGEIAQELEEIEINLQALSLVDLRSNRTIARLMQLLKFGMRLFR